MCNPIAIGAVMAAGSMIMKGGEIAQNNKNAERMGKNAVKAANTEYQSNRLRAVTANEKAQIDKWKRRQQAMREQSKIIVGAGEAGVIGGVSPVRAIVNSMMQSSIDVGLTEANRQNQMEMVKLQNEATYNQAKARISQAEAMAVSPFMAMLQVSMSGAQGFASGYMGASAMGIGGSGATGVYGGQTAMSGTPTPGQNFAQYGSMAR